MNMLFPIIAITITIIAIFIMYYASVTAQYRFVNQCVGISPYLTTLIFVMLLVPFNPLGMLILFYVTFMWFFKKCKQNYYNKN